MITLLYKMTKSNQIKSVEFSKRLWKWERSLKYFWHRKAGESEVQVVCIAMMKTHMHAIYASTYVRSFTASIHSGVNLSVCCNALHYKFERNLIRWGNERFFWYKQKEGEPSESLMIYDNVLLLLLLASSPIFYCFDIDTLLTDSLVAVVAIAENHIFREILE